MKKLSITVTENDTRGFNMKVEGNMVNPKDLIFYSKVIELNLIKMTNIGNEIIENGKLEKDHSKSNKG